MFSQGSYLRNLSAPNCAPHVPLTLLLCVHTAQPRGPRPLHVVAAWVRCGRGGPPAEALVGPEGLNPILFHPTSLQPVRSEHKVLYVFN